MKRLLELPLPKNSPWRWEGFLQFRLAISPSLENASRPLTFYKKQLRNVSTAELSHLRPTSKYGRTLHMIMGRYDDGTRDFEESFRITESKLDERALVQRIINIATTCYLPTGMKEQTYASYNRVRDIAKAQKNMTWESITIALYFAEASLYFGDCISSI